MRFIIKDRGSGKSTGLLFASAATGYRIIVHTETQVELLEKEAEKLELDIPEPMTVERYKSLKLKDEGLFIDEVGYVLSDILDQYFGTHVFAGTMTDSYRERKQYEESIKRHKKGTYTDVLFEGKT